MHHPFVAATLALVQEGDTGPISEIITSDAVVWHNYDDLAQDLVPTFPRIAGLSKIVDNLELEVVAEDVIDDGVVVQLVFRGDIKHNGKKLDVRNCIFLRGRDGKLARMEEYVDPNMQEQMMG